MMFFTLGFLKFFLILVSINWLLVLFRIPNFRKFWLLFGSLYFWGAGNSANYRYPFLLLISLLGNYLIYLLLTNKKISYGIFAVIAWNITIILFSFQDFIQFITNGASVFLPYNYSLGVGLYSIAFLQFHLDFYKREKQDPVSFPDFLLFGSFFPVSNAGPILRWRRFQEEIGTSLSYFFECIGKGSLWILIGFLKKFLLADPLSQGANSLFSFIPGHSSLSNEILGVYSNVFLIYLQFSSYVDMGRGTAKLLGYNLPLNFRSPFFSESVREYALRWNRTLGIFLKNVFYRSVRNRKSYALIYLAFICIFYFLLYRLSWVSLIFSAVLFVALFIEYKFPFKEAKSSVIRIFRVLLTFHIWVVLWQVFRFRDMQGIERYSKNILNFGPELYLSSNEVLYIFLIFAITILLQFLEKKYRRFFI